MGLRDYEPSDYKTTGPLDDGTTEPRHCKTMRLLNYERTRLLDIGLQDYRTEGQTRKC